jgi:hypothetical protein
LRRIHYFMSLLCTLTIALVLVLPNSVSAGSQQELSSINNLPVIYVQTPENTSTLTSGNTVTVVLDNISASLEESVQIFMKNVEANKSLVAPGGMIEVYGGPGATKEQYIKVHDETQSFAKSNGPIKLGPPPTISPEQQNAISPMAATTITPSFAIIQNTDPSSRTVIGIAAHMSGINIGTSQLDHSAFLVNGVANSNRYFLQSGQLFAANGTRYHVWSDDTHGQIAQYFNLNLIPYTTGVEYEYEINYMGSTGVWWMSAENYSTGAYDYFIEYYGQGTRLITDTGTSVFFENWNTNANWYTGFQLLDSSYHAREMNSSYQWVNWSNQTIVIKRGTTTYPNNGKITGSLVNNSSAVWDLTKLILAQ